MSQGNLTLDDVVVLMRAYKGIPQVKTSEYVPRGMGYRIVVEGREMVLLHPDDLAELSPALGGEK